MEIVNNLGGGGGEAVLGNFFAFLSLHKYCSSSLCKFLRRFWVIRSFHNSCIDINSKLKWSHIYLQFKGKCGFSYVYLAVQFIIY